MWKLIQQSDIEQQEKDIDSHAYNLAVGHCMTLVMRYLLARREERETKYELKSWLFGSDRPSGLYRATGVPLTGTSFMCGWMVK